MSLLLAVFLAPLAAEASVFSFITNLFASDTSAEDATDTVNSQQIPLLQAANNVDPTPTSTNSLPAIITGNSIMTVAGPSGTAADIKVTSDQISTYTVHTGDTLSSVAKMFGVTVNTILWANDLKPGSSLKKDQVLVILPVSGVSHVVKKGETLKSIASSFNGDIDEIAQFNNLSSTAKLSVGDTIIIPDGETTPSVGVADAAPAKSATKSSSSSKEPILSAPIIGSSGDGSSSQYVDTTGYFMRPISGGYRTQGLHGHNAVDLADSVGTPIMAAAAGDVIISRSGGWNGGYGSYIVISHDNGTQTLYAHLSKNIAQVGDQVSKGQVIGLMGDTGESTGPHVHFEVRGGKNPF